MAPRMFGDPDRFAIGHELRPDPDRASNADAWGALSLWVGGRNLTRGRMRDGTIADEAEIPLLPVAAWFVDHWDALFNESRLPVPSLYATSAAQWVDEKSRLLPMNQGAMFERIELVQDYRGRHGLCSALPGYRVAEVYVRRVEDRVEVS